MRYRDPSPGRHPEHVPVLVDAVLEWLQPHAGGLYVDATVGAGGHAERILEACGPDGQLVGIDRDPDALEAAGRRLSRFTGRVRLVSGDFRHLRDVLQEAGVREADGILFDLGVSSLQLERAERGFSFQLPGPLDMRMDPRQPQTAADLVNRLPENQLAELLLRYGEEPFARRIARSIVRRRPLRTTTDLAEAVQAAVPRSRWPRRTHVATRTFQALRIATNQELEALEAALAQVPDVLRPGARVVVISFHSLEDRLVKQAFRSDPRLRQLTLKPVRPGPEELRQNPRARSARLRAAERVEGLR
ncbi:MAG: 16S rRNA (cytosine(1402)-N(4))-methyltransferase RsmH [Armatimonadota bacterium]|nr:16S rRNA (cytosine(1402)-N(4))-methyltransferase RsmH [Armatimonadota bacterium]MDR7406436.1 16S rRNA (cytosine(1402)-N(4))-methyltransferase RsmH [Armatimonadota bacterium]